MVFSSLVFLLFFLPLLLLFYFTVPNLRHRNGILLLFSLLFYAWGEPVWILCMLGSTLINYLCGLLIGKAESLSVKRAVLAVGILASLAALFYFKYAAFLFNSLCSLLPVDLHMQELALPIGISFYTFQILTYTVDVYRKKVPVQQSFFRLLLYVCCFPQLIAGPIVQYGDIALQLQERRTTLEDFSRGMGRFSVGLGKKVLLANLCGAMTEALLLPDAPLSLAGAWLSAVMYSLQLYFDFSAYSDMAIGLGSVFGFKYKENFNYPYISRGISEFWRRWHISLGSFFRDYVYIPLGGNRQGALKTVRNLLVVWALTGLWHGASWNFVLWGLYYGILILLERFVFAKVLERIPGFFRLLLTLVLVVFGWVLFYHVELSQGLRHLGAMVGIGISGLTDSHVTAQLNTYTVLPVIAALCALPIVPYLKAFLKERSKTLRVIGYVLQLCFQTAVLLLSVASLVGSSYNPFIYFRF